MAYRQPDRYQGVLFPPTIEEMVADDSPVRVYDAMVAAMDMKQLGIELDHCKVGCPEYEPLSMLKLLVFGYSYGIRSSRKLERACHDNVSFIWLMGGLKPNFKTISEFRRKNKKALARVIKQCARLCVKMNVIAGNVLFLDGSKFRANASIDRSYTQKKIQKKLEGLDKQIETLLEQCEQVDQQESDQPSLAQVQEELKDAQTLKSKVESALEELQAEDNHKEYINITDSDCGRMHSRQGSHAGYNGQVVTDEKNGLIVHCDVVSDNNDINQFANQINQANDVIEGQCSVACADAGYCYYEELEKIDRQGLQVVVPSRIQASQSPVQPFDKSRFIYNTEKDSYLCPGGKELTRRGYCKRDNCYIYRYGKACDQCEHFGVCTKDKHNGRKIIRYANEAFRQRITEEYAQAKTKELYDLRKNYAEHPFGHIKRNLGAGHFLLRGLEGVRAELSLLSSCFNISRLVTLLGVEDLLMKLKQI